MFLHVGGDVVIELHDLVSIVDARCAMDGTSTGEAVQAAARAGALYHAAAGPPKSYVICVDRVYGSPISPTTLRRRAGVLPFES